MITTTPPMPGRYRIEAITPDGWRPMACCCSWPTEFLDRAVRGEWRVIDQQARPTTPTLFAGGPNHPNGGLQ